MVVCPKGTSLQKKANYLYSQRSSVFGFENSSSSFYDQVKDAGDGHVTSDSSERSECGGSFKADKKGPLTARDEFFYVFVSAILDILLQSWEGKPCVKPKLGQQSESEPKDFGESELDMVPCDEPFSASAADLIKDLYDKRTSNLSKELSTGTSKLKKSSSSNCSEEYLKYEDFELPETGNPSQTFSPEESVYLVFTNNVSYKGGVFRRLMDGEGTYSWEDGTTYQGKFEDGCATGTGVLAFPDLSVYEGEVYKAFRHGEGLLCMSESPVMYSGQWWLGKKHGEGLIVYNEPSEGLNFYKGQWENGVKEGFGIRQYTSGAKYIGFWSNGTRHGKGVMLWSNNDIYRGEWKNGLMHGYGDYTWNGFINDSLSYPVSNTYRGYWAEGKRNGQGLLETTNEILIETVWVENMKEGPGAVICCNGAIVTADNLFYKDKQSLTENREDDPGMVSRKIKNDVVKKDMNEDNCKNISKNKTTIEAISIPIYLPIQTLDLSQYTKYLSIKSKIFGLELDERESSSAEHSDTKIVKNTGDDLSVCLAEEEKSLRNAIVLRLPQLRACYEYYATIACEKPPSFKCVLLRIFLWQMLIDLNIPSSNLSLVDIDKMLAQQKYLYIRNAHDPFERIQFWQFIHVLIILSWHLYGKYVFDQNLLIEDQKIVDFLLEFDSSGKERILKKAFDYFLDKVVFTTGFMSADGKNDFIENDLAPMKPMYIVYRKIGEPHSAKDFVSKLCGKGDQKTIVPELVKYFVKLPMYKVKEGKNVMTVAGEISYVSGSEPFNFPKIMGFEKKTVESQPDFTCFSNLKPKKVIKCLAKVCPGIVDDGLIIKMDYQLTFLEFYKAIIICTELSLKMNIMNTLRDDILEEHKANMKEYEMLLSEYEKKKNSTAASSKKSRQLSDLSRKGKK